MRCHLSCHHLVMRRHVTRRHLSRVSSGLLGGAATKTLSRHVISQIDTFSCIGWEVCKASDNCIIDTESCHGELACAEAKEGTSISDNSCIGNGACKGASMGTQISKESCVGIDACKECADLIVSAQSCIGNQVCSNSTACTIDQGGSCKGGEQTCSYMEDCLIGPGSCLGDFACMSAKNVEVSKASCIGVGACQDTPFQRVGKESCVGTGSCSLTTDATPTSSSNIDRAFRRLDDDEVPPSVGDNSCVCPDGVDGCCVNTYVGIGKGSCNCDGCCNNCSEESSTIPEDSCNDITEDCSGHCVVPTESPSLVPSSSPSESPSSAPSISPTAAPTTSPSSSPSESPSFVPSTSPTAAPTASSQPSAPPTVEESSNPSLKPSSYPSMSPSRPPSSKPSEQASSIPSSGPTAQPSNTPTGLCDIDFYSTCHSSLTVDCSEIPGIEDTVCSDRPSTMTLRFLGGTCMEGSNSQDTTYVCNDDASIEADTEYYIEAWDPNDSSTYFTGFAKVGDDITLTPEGSRMGAVVQILIHGETTGSTGQYDTDIQQVTFQSACSANLALGDTFGGFQVAGFVNSEQDLTMYHNVTVEFTAAHGLDTWDDTIPFAPLSLTGVIQPGNKSFDLSDSITGQPLNPTNGDQWFYLSVEVDLTVTRQYEVISEFVATWLTDSSMVCEPVSDTLKILVDAGDLAEEVDESEGGDAVVGPDPII